MQSLFLITLIASISMALAIPEWYDQRNVVPLHTRSVANICGDIKCNYGGYYVKSDQEMRCVCYKGPGEVCGGHDNIFGRCEQGLECNTCGRCLGCAHNIKTGFKCYEDNCM